MHPQLWRGLLWNPPSTKKNFLLRQNDCPPRQGQRCHAIPRPSPQDSYADLANLSQLSRP